MANIDSIAALSTPAGYGGIAVIRVSGALALTVADSLFLPLSRKDKPSMWDGYSCAYGRIVYKGETLDECILTVYKAPHSYTGEDVIEISAHGGMLSAKTILRAVFALGVRPANAGEFTERAVFNNKFTLTQAEAVMDIIAAKGQAELRSALKVREGALYKRIKAVSDNLTLLLAKLSVAADYPDDEDFDIRDINNEFILSVLEHSTAELANLTGQFSAGQLIKAGIPLCIAGKPNVGKSSILNLLSGSERSIVTSIPGTTRDVIEQEITIGDLTFCLFDTAGIHETLDPVESEGTSRAKRKIAESEGILAVFDGSEELDGADEEIINLTGGRNAVAVLNKCDKISKINKEYISKMFPKTVEISAKTGQGLNELSKIITEAFSNGISGTEIFLNERQYFAARSAETFLNQTKIALSDGVLYDGITILIDNAVEKLLELTGENLQKAVTDSVFKNFCVGK